MNASQTMCLCLVVDVLACVMEYTVRIVCFCVGEFEASWQNIELDRSQRAKWLEQHAEMHSSAFFSAQLNKTCNNMRRCTVMTQPPYPKITLCLMVQGVSQSMLKRGD